MVYEDESSNDLSSLLYISSSDDGMQYQESDNCGFVQWVGPEWHPTLWNALLKLWEMHEDSGSDRRNDNLESSLTIHYLTKEKNKIEGNYDKFVKDVHELFNAQEERMIDFSYMNAKMKGVEITTSVVSNLKREMEKKDAEMFKLQEKCKVLMNLAEAQGTVIRNLKNNHLKEKEQLGEASMKLQLQVDELNQSQEELTQENKKLKLHIDDLKKGHEKLTTGRAELKLHIADLLRAEERNSHKLKGIHHILAE
ncbi:hypothetical protein D1007_40200 [Hordeum vulgare]|nr:hypothetical protein D1007_40200 [Hordeum vulgare]